MGDRYDDMTGPVLAEELARRDLNVSGRVDELRARLREDDARQAQAAADTSGSPDEGEEVQEQKIGVPEPWEPVDYTPMSVILTEAQARDLTAGEARLRQFVKHVNRTTPRKYTAGDTVVGIADWANRVCSVLPFGVEIELTPSAGEA